jgi:hypothetical protein
VGSADFLSGWDTTILMVPFLGMLFMHMFRLDERVSGRKAPPRSRRSFCGVDAKGRPYVSDPDGQPWRRPGLCEIEGRIEPAAHSEGRAMICEEGSEDFRLARKTVSIIHI